MGGPGLRAVALPGALIALSVAAVQLASCQVRLLSAASAEGRMQIQNAIAEDDRAIAARREDRLQALLAASDAGRAEQERIATYYAALISGEMETEESGDSTCPTPDEWAALLHCAPPHLR